MPSINAITGWSMAAAAAATSVLAGDAFDTPNPPPPIPQEDIMGKPKPVEPCTAGPKHVYTPAGKCLRCGWCKPTAPSTPIAP